jgi:small-conductance mechanosensitive channel
MGWLERSTNAAFDQFGRRHERGLIRLYIWRIVGGWLLAGVAVLAFLAYRSHAFEVALRWIVESSLRITIVVVLTLGIVIAFRIAAAMRNPYRVPRRPRGFR